MNLSPRLEKVIWILGVIAALIILPLYAVKVHLKTDYTDFMVYHRAAVRALHGEQIYTLSDGASPFRYLPLLMPLFAGLGLLELAPAQLLWYFIQYGCFSLGLYFIYKTLRTTASAQKSLTVTVLSFFFIVRFCLDTFTIGQVSSVMFLGYCLGLYGFVTQRFFLSGLGLFIPTIFKIGPGISYTLFIFSRTNERIRAWLAPVLATLFLGLFTTAIFGWTTLKGWIDGWLLMVSKDSQYYDASHYGSQSLKSVLLRFANRGFLSVDTATTIHWVITVLGCLALLAFWRLRKPTSPRARGVFFSLGVFPYLWFMPETFKYSLTVLALPIAFLLLSENRTKIRAFSLFFMFFGASAAGKDLMPDFLFFGFQKASIPFIATLFLAWALWKEAREDSLTSAEVPNYALGPWKELPKTVGCEFSVISPLSAIASVTDEASPYTVLDRTCEKLTKIYGTKWEWIAVVPQLVDPAEQFAVQKTISEIQKRIPKERLKVIFSELVGRSSALREGFIHSSGKVAYLMRWEQPVDPNFLKEACLLIGTQKFQAVRGNRRLSESRFEIPVKHLRVAYGRHRLGLLFNRLVRIVLPAIKTTDTHSGHVILTRSVASQVFSLQTSADFLFDLELALALGCNDVFETDIPVRLYLFEEKSGGRIFAEVIAILTGLFRLRSRFKKGCYSPIKDSKGVTADDWGLSPAINQGILELAKNGTINRVSIMANCEYMTDGLHELRSIPEIQLGLHFNLTYGTPLTDYKALPPKTFLLRWIFQKKKVLLSIQAELDAQLKSLQDLGIQPDYFDGHHHIHIVPGLMEELASRVKKAGIQTVRLPYDPGLWLSAKFPLLIFSYLSRSTLKRHGFQSMRVFYPSLIHFQDHGLLRAKMNENPFAEVIVHPAIRNDLAEIRFPDPYTEGRVREYQALRMLAFTLQAQETSQ
jgi:predicted glycoside hydrolase/deacetylase ChbG (UPF0249 family)